MMQQRPTPRLTPMKEILDGFQDFGERDFANKKRPEKDLLEDFLLQNLTYPSIVPKVQRQATLLP